jgi:hypothetical protein
VSIKNLENQVGQIATTLTSRPNGSFPSTTETLTSTSIDKGKETCKVIHLRSGNEYEGLIMGTLVTKEPQRRPVDDPAASQSRPQLSPAINSEEPSPRTEPESTADKTPDDTKTATTSSLELIRGRPPPPFPQRLRRAKEEKQFDKFIKIMR